MKKYVGVLSGKSDMPKIALRAYQAWLDQRKRCTNSKSKSFKTYGACGIRVEYSSREFVNWYLKEYEKRPRWKKPVCGRKDHSKNYSFDNIELIEFSENAREAAIRTGHIGKKPSIPILVLERKTLEPIMYFKSRKEAEEVTGISAKNIWLICSGETKGTRCGLTFRYCNPDGSQLVE